jgi:hypothetical protein
MSQTFHSGDVLDRATVATAVARWQDHAVTAFEQTVRFFGFEHYGKPFTRVALVLTPKVPLMASNRRVVVICSEGVATMAEPSFGMMPARRVSGRGWPVAA